MLQQSVQETPPGVPEGVGRWSAQFDDLGHQIAPRFARKDVRRHAMDYLRGLLGAVERKNGWQLAEAAGDATPTAIQHLLGRAVWNADEIRDDLRAYVIRHLGDPGAVLIVDETGFLKKGRHSVGVQRQYSGTAGRIENCQIGVFLAYAGKQGRAFIDRELYLPREWTDDPARCQAAGVPKEKSFATKPQLAKAMIERAIMGKVPFAWVTGDEIYGNDRRLRVWLEEQDRSYVLAIARNQYVWRESLVEQRAPAVLDEIADTDWQRLSAGDGAKGPRLYDWAYVPMLSWMTTQQRGLLVRRSLDGKKELAYYAVYAPFGTPLSALVQVAGRRWAIEEGFEASKQLVGLDQYEVRSWTGWYRHITLALLAHAYLAVLRQAAITLDLKKRNGDPGPSSLQAFKARRGCCH